jgi:hypothetical protein
MMELRLSLAPPSRAGEPGFVSRFRLKNAVFRLLGEIPAKALTFTDKSSENQ